MVYLDGLQYVVIEIREARVLVHHAVDELGELQQEGLAGGQTIGPYGLYQVYHVGNHLGPDRGKNMLAGSGP